MIHLLPAQTLTSGDYEPVEEGLRRAVSDLLFIPLAQIWHDELGGKLEYKNSKETDEHALAKALRRGKLQMSKDAKGDYVFSGEKSAQIGRAIRVLGGTYDHRDGTYHLKAEFVPPSLITASTAHTMACERMHQRMGQFLDGMSARIEGVVNLLRPGDINADKAIRRVVKGTQDALGKVSIAFDEPTPEQREEIANAYTENLKLYIKRWLSQDIVQLRKEVEASARTGARASTLVTSISSRYEVSQSKARFLARNETGNFMAVYHQQKYEAAGVPRYIWRTSKDCDVRKEPNGGHAALEGRIFTWAEGAPAKYMSSKKNCNPHADYNCRCGAVGLIESDYNVNQKTGEKYVPEK